MSFDRQGAQALMYITPRPELAFVRGEGSWLEDHTGKRYLDAIQGWAVNCLGHCPPVVVEAINRQAATLINPSPAFYNEPSMALARRLAETSGLARTFFANSGAEANEGAIKLARKWGRLNRQGAYKIITFRDAFHGRTLATMSASGKPGWDTLFAPQVDGFPKAVLNDIASVEALVDDQTVAVMLEPVQGEAGVIPATREFLAALRALCDAHGLLLIFDEVQTGCGRTGTLFAFQGVGVTPDIMTLGKGIGAGVPLAALCASERVSCFEPGDQGGTYNGNPLMTAVGVAVIDALTAPGFMASVRARGEQLSQGLQALSAELGLGKERGAGLLRALELGRDDGAAIVEAGRQLSPHGVLLNAARPTLLRFMPALNITADEVDQLLALTRQAIQQVRG